MNEALLPLGHARFNLVSVNADGSFLRCPFVTRELAEGTAALLRQTAPEGEFFVTEPTGVLPGLKGKV